MAYNPPLNGANAKSVVTARQLILCPRALDMEIDEIKQKVRTNQYVYSLHADVERKAESLTLAQIEQALLTGRILEQYADTGRGESCLVVGFSGEVPVHVVCGWRGEKVAVITVNVPRAPEFIDPWTRRKK